jgi:hypothetical protein
MVGRPDDDRIDFILHLVEHHTKILVSLRLWVFLEGLCGVFFMNITQGYDILGSPNAVNIGGAAPSDADPGNV